MGDVTDVRLAMAEALRQEFPDVQVLAYQPANPTPPTLFIRPGEIDYHRALEDGYTEMHMSVIALIGAQEVQEAQRVLDEMLSTGGEGSVKGVLEADSRLSALGDPVADDLMVVRTKGYRIYPVAGRDLLGAEWDVLILPKTPE